MNDRPGSRKKNRSRLLGKQFPRLEQSEEEEQARLVNRLADLKALLYDALEAGKYLAPGAEWQPYLEGESLSFRDRGPGHEIPGLLIVAPTITADIATASVMGDCPTCVLIGATLAPQVDLGALRVERVRREEPEPHYWAVFVLAGATLVTLGTPPSSCRLIGEMLNAQMSTPFVQSRVCAHCHALNDYHARHCVRCHRPLMATGRFR